MWLLNGEELNDMASGYVAFVYIITNLETHKRYIGKKKFEFFKMKKVKGRVNRKKVTCESDWKDYYGSNEELKEDVKKLGTDKFKREILRLCHSLSEASYYETKFILENDALLYPDAWYNSWVSVKLNRNTLVKKVKGKF